MEQFAHAAYAAVLVVAFALGITPWVAILLSIAVGVVRELEQKEWDWRLIGRTDMVFWTIGAIAAAIGVSL